MVPVPFDARYVRSENENNEIKTGTELSGNERKFILSKTLAPSMNIKREDSESAIQNEKLHLFKIEERSLSSQPISLQQGMSTTANEITNTENQQASFENREGKLFSTITAKLKCFTIFLLLTV